MQTNKGYVLITGATSGIGRELARLFAKDKYNLIIVSRNAEALSLIATELIQQHGIDVITIEKDLFVPQNPFEVYEEIMDRGLRIDILVNDAGQGLYGEFINTDIYRELDIIQLNIATVVVLTKLFLKDMVSRGEGKILNLASIAGKTPGPYQSVYHATKAFVHSFTEAIRSEVKDKGITVTSLLPGATATDFFNKAGMLNAKNIKDAKLADAADVAKDGYEALMNGDDMVISGLKNKVQVAMSNLMPDSMVADNVLKQQSPSDK